MLLWIIAFIFLVLVGALAAPFLRWIFYSGWEWMPLWKLLRYVFGMIPIGVMAGGMFTLYEWWQHADASLPRKILVTIVVVASLILVMNEGIDGIFWIMDHWKH